MPDPREAAKAAEKRIKDDDVIRKVPKPKDPIRPHTEDDSGGSSPTPPPPHDPDPVTGG